MGDYDFPIYFSDLTPEAQQRLCEAVHITDPKEMNWDMDIVPLAIYPLPYPEDDDEENPEGEQP